MGSLNPNSAIPVYRQLADIIREQISSGELARGAPLPSETYLMGLHEISRDTVRRAISVLRDQHLVITVQGKGSYVADEPA